MKLLAIAFMAANVSFGCGHEKATECSTEPCYSDAAIDTIPIDAFVCTATTPCPAGSAAVCDLDADADHGMCVACTGSDASACTGATPACGSDHACRACIAHSECASDACLPDGSCGSAGTVAYVAPAGSGSACTFAAPCATVTAALATARPYVKITGTIDDAVSVGSGRVVTFLADPGAELKRSSAGPALTVTGNGTSITIYDLAVTSGANDASSVGILIPTASGNPVIALERTTVLANPGGGIVTTGGTLNVERSTIAQNTGGGISLDNTQFHIENSFITQNGGVSSSFGGIKVDDVTTAGTYELDFDTIAGNGSLAAFVAGVQCGAVAVPVLIDSDVIYYGNAGGSNQLTPYASPTPECVATFSDVEGPGSSSGSGNFNADPLFVDSADSPGNFHIHAGSPCIGAADPSLTSVMVDFDGDARGSSRDVGADQVGP